MFGGYTNWLIIIIIGGLAGALAKLLTPGRGPGGCIVTVLLGIAGAFVGTWTGRFAGLYGPTTRPASSARSSARSSSCSSIAWFSAGAATSAICVHGSAMAVG